MAIVGDTTSGMVDIKRGVVSGRSRGAGRGMM